LKDLKNIIVGCVQSSHRDQKRLYENYYGYCLKIVFRYIYHYDKAVEVVNDGFLKIFRNLSRFTYSDQENIEMIFMGWIRRIMVNTAIDLLRKESLLPEIGSITETVWLKEDKSQSPDQALLYKELINEIKKLPPSYRLVFNMYVVDGFSHQEIADQLGISVGTSKSNLSKAREHMKKIIMENDQQIKVCNF
jgi:RNA polymerase sigma-70 factor (ECF subfamily)